MLCMKYIFKITGISNSQTLMQLSPKNYMLYNQKKPVFMKFCLPYSFSMPCQ